LSILKDTQSEESGFFLIAIVGSSSQVITSLAGITSSLALSYFKPSNAFFVSSSLPTKATLKPSFALRASTAPLTISTGALSHRMRQLKSS